MIWCVFCTHSFCFCGCTTTPEGRATRNNVTARSSRLQNTLSTNLKRRKVLQFITKHSWTCERSAILMSSTLNFEKEIISLRWNLSLDFCFTFYLCFRATIWRCLSWTASRRTEKYCPFYYCLIFMWINLIFISFWFPERQLLL